MPKFTFRHQLLTVACLGAVLTLFVVRLLTQTPAGWQVQGPQTAFGMTCGDGIIENPEECDDSNTSDNDGCSSTCTVESGWGCAGEPSFCNEICGNGIITSSESCDDSNTSNGDGCSSACQVESGWSCMGEPSVCGGVCGDGSITGSEACDDGDTVANDGCSVTCTIESGWSCVGEPSVCSELCGDGIVTVSEGCDDSNTNSGDGCSNICSTETGWNCSGQPSSCSEVCGDSVVVGTEECDDGNTTNGDGCSSACLIELGVGICQTNALAYWKFDEGAGITAIDALSTNDGTYTNMGTDDWVTPGSATQFRNPYAISLDGSDDYIDLGTGVFDLASDFSVSTWIFLNNSTLGTIAQNRGSAAAGTQDGWALSVSGSRLFFHLEDGGVSDTTQGGSSLASNQWYYVVATFDRDTGTKTLYVNGVSDFTNTTAGLISADFTSGLNSTIGALWDDSSTQSNFWRGQLDDLRLHARELSTAEISFLLSGGSTNSGCFTCGDGSVHETEQCDDGNTTGTDGCSSQCLNEAGWVCAGDPSSCTEVCGDDIVVGTEECEPNLHPQCTQNCQFKDGGGGGTNGGPPASSSSSSQTSSSSSFEPPPGCGDAIVSGDEECDDGRNNGLGDCTLSCTRLFCGDGLVSPPFEECEPIPFANPDGSRSFFVPACGDYCSLPTQDENGDPVRDEEGRTDGGCLFVEGPVCPEQDTGGTGGAGDTGDSGNNGDSGDSGDLGTTGDTGGATPPPSDKAVCGNGVVEGDEQCDAGGFCQDGTYDGTYWSDATAAAICEGGGGRAMPWSGDGCSETCKREFCGDGIVQGRGADGKPDTADDELCDNGSVCSDTGRRCTSVGQCSPGATCIYNFDKAANCNQHCQLESCVYTLRVDISDLQEGTHSFQVTVTDERGISDVDATIFTVGKPLLSTETTSTFSTAQLFNAPTYSEHASSWFAQLLPGQQLQTTLVTDIDHYIKENDFNALLTVTVYNEAGLPVCGLDPSAFNLKMDGGEVAEEKATFIESTGPQCGDGVRQTGEQCDDGNTDAGDGCSATCQLEEAPRPKPDDLPTPPTPTAAVCGNGLIEPGEACDDGNILSGDGCSASCKVEVVCGNGTVETGEACDDGNLADGDGCSALCRVEEQVNAMCGNGRIDEPEQCDDGDRNSDTEPDSCRVLCVFPHCGDYVLDAGEECDNGLGNSDTLPDHCRTTCVLPTCGDGVKDASEECDGGQYCLPNCRRQSQPECGNGFREFGEQCDDGNTRPGDGCSPLCLAEPLIAGIALCGNGVEEEGEDCDDGNSLDGDGCSKLCAIEKAPPPPPPVHPAPLVPTPAPPLLPPPQPAWPPLSASLIPVRYDYAPVGDTGPAATIVVTIGAASGLAWMRRRKQ